jgi:predicted nuclease of restriction endonuclease-like (RecB) superfamily
VEKTMKKISNISGPAVVECKRYDEVFSEIVLLLAATRSATARAANVFMTASYWEIGRRIVVFEQHGSSRASYGEGLMRRLATDLRNRFGRGFSLSNLKQFKNFYLAYPCSDKGQTLSGLLDGTPVRPKGQTIPGFSAGANMPTIVQTVSGQSAADSLKSISRRFPLSWSHYVRLLNVRMVNARNFYEAEALRGGWTVRQLDRQIQSQFYERTLLSRNKAAMLRNADGRLSEDAVFPEEEIKDPFILEFLGLKDEYSESDLEEALIRQLEAFLLELGGDFAFIGRQRRLRIGDEWYRIDLLFFHRRLRCLVVIDLKLGKFTHADAGQMHLYLNYASEHWTNPGENPPVGLVLCAHKDDAVAHYALENLPNKVLASDYRLALPDERILEAELTRTRRLLQDRRSTKLVDSVNARKAKAAEKRRTP